MQVVTSVKEHGFSHTFENAEWYRCRMWIGIFMHNGIWSMMRRYSENSIPFNLYRL